MTQAAQPFRSNQIQDSGRVSQRSTILELVKRVQQLETEKANTEKAQEALKESEERFRLISETIHFGVYELDEKGSCLYKS